MYAISVCVSLSLGHQYWHMCNFRKYTCRIFLKYRKIPKCTEKDCLKNFIICKTEVVFHQTISRIPSESRVDAWVISNVDRLIADNVALLFYVHGKHLRSCRDGQLT